jgi:transposase-like protein
MLGWVSGGDVHSPLSALSPSSLPPEIIGHAVWLYFRFPLSLRMVEEMLAARGICVTYETMRQWGKKFGKRFSDRIRHRAPARFLVESQSNIQL